MLGISLRYSDNVDLQSSLSKYVSANYSQNELKTLQPTIISIHQDRQQLCQSFTKGDADPSTILAACQHYLTRLAFVSAHFPFAREGTVKTGNFLSRLVSGSVPTVSVPFIWSDAFRSTNKATDYNLAFERASMAFNMGALYSRIATNAKTRKDDGGVGLKDACAAFQQAAGVFEWMIQSVDVMAASSLSFDFSSDVLHMLKFLMLAQAQACFFERSTSTTTNYRLIAKLAMGTADLFKQAYGYANKGALVTVFARTEVYHWDYHIYFQLMAYQAASNYWYAKSMVADKNDKYGEEIAHLQRALSCLSNAKRVESHLVKSLAENRSRLEQAIHDRLAVAEKDNNSVYFAIVPKSDSLKDPDVVTTVKTTPFTFPTIDNSPDPFAILVPPIYRESQAQFKTKLTQLVQNANVKHREQEDLVRAMLASNNLPAAIQSNNAGVNESPLPDATWNSLRECVTAGGVRSLDDLSNTLQARARECEASHSTLVNQLLAERGEDNDMRHKFGHRWNRRPSEQLTTTLVMDCEAIGKFLSEASKSNAKLFTEFEENRKVFDYLNKSRNDIEAKFPQNFTAISDETLLAHENAVRALVDELNNSVEKSNQKLKEWTDDASKADIIPLLMQANSASKSPTPSTGSSNTNPSNDAVVNEHYQRYEASLKELDTYYKQFEDLMARIQKSFDDLQSSRNAKGGADNGRALRQSILQEINQCVATFHRLQRHFNEGLTFYSDLEVHKIRPLRQRISDFILARSEEQKMLLNQLTQEFSGMSLNNNNNNPTPASNNNSPYAAISSASAPPASYNPSAIPSAPSFPSYPANPNLSADKPSFYGSIAPSSTPSSSTPASNVSASSSSQQWNCKVCTYLNPPLAPVCAMCGDKH